MPPVGNSADTATRTTRSPTTVYTVLHMATLLPILATIVDGRATVDVPDSAAGTSMDGMSSIEPSIIVVEGTIISIASAVVTTGTDSTENGTVFETDTDVTSNGPALTVVDGHDWGVNPAAPTSTATAHAAPTSTATAHAAPTTGTGNSTQIGETKGRMGGAGGAGRSGPAGAGVVAALVVGAAIAFGL